MRVFHYKKFNFWPTKGHPWKLRKKAFVTQAKGVFTVSGPSVIQVHDLKQIQLVTNLGYDVLYGDSHLIVSHFCIGSIT